MITDGMIAMLERLIELCDSSAVVTGIEIVCDALMDYSEDGWYMMSDTERKLWLCDVLTRYHVSFVQDK